MNWPGELHSEAGLISGDQAAAGPVGINSRSPEHNRGNHQVDNLLSSQYKPKPFDELVYPMDLRHKERPHQLLSIWM
ncbi:hypothetical protein SynSYN20_01143 [Synechococcus sp. SYN20]|nr:hypothetical protein SynSYN20_01143 [Synechococcus sp. SYN20]